MIGKVSQKMLLMFLHITIRIYLTISEEKMIRVLKQSIKDSSVLRYGENPHQKGIFYGNLDELFTKLHGKELSYNNLLDVDAAVQLMNDFQDEDPTFAILKHNNACGLATRELIG